MGRRKTHEEFVTEMKKKNSKVDIIGTYINSATKVQCKCKINSHIWYGNPRDLLRGHGCPMCDKSHKSTHEEFIQKMNEKHPKILVKGTYINNHTKILVKCLIDGYEWQPTPNDLLDGTGCPCCSNRVIVKGTNDLATTHSHLLKYFDNPDDATNVTYGSHKSVKLKCPECGQMAQRIVKTLVKDGFICQYCSDGISYPNKFCRALLKQLPITNFIPEYCPEWILPKKYDNYFEYNNQLYILEADGAFHTNDMYGITAEESKQVDDYKDEQAKLHNIDVIRIETEVSNMEYIKERVLNSQLNELFDLSDIDWIECDRCASSSVVIKICEDYMKLNANGILDKRIGEVLAKENSIATVTVQRYLKRGAKMGLCDYNPQKSKEYYDEIRSLPITVFDLENNKIGEFLSTKKCSKKISEISHDNYSDTGIRYACKRKNHKYKNYIFIYTHEIETDNKTTEVSINKNLQ